MHFPCLIHLIFAPATVQALLLIFSLSQESTTPSDSVWVWLSESGDIYYDIYERCRFRVEAEVWHDVAPQGPQLADKDGNGEDAEDVNRNKVPYSLVVRLFSTFFSWLKNLYFNYFLFGPM